MACRNCFKYPFCEKCEGPQGHCEDEKSKRIMLERNNKMELDQDELKATKNIKEKTTNKCKNCKYFERHTGEYSCNKYGNCYCIKFVYGSSFIHNDSSYNDYDETKADELLYEDYEGYSADFEVGENFGCIHFENKE